MNEQGTAPKPPVQVVLDTNTVLDMLLFEDAVAQPLRHAISGACLRWLGTERMLAELRGVLQRPHMGRWQPPAQAGAVLAFAARWMHLAPAPAPGSAPRCRDAADQVFIDLAWCNDAAWLLTRDKALLKLARPARARGLRICTPAAWASSGAWAVGAGGSP